MATDSSNNKKGGRQDQAGQESGSILDTDPLAELARLVAESAPFGPLDAKSPSQPAIGRSPEVAPAQRAPVPPEPSSFRGQPEAPAVSAPLTAQRRVPDEARPRAAEAAVMPRQDAPLPGRRPSAAPVEPLVPPRNLTPPPASPPPPPRPSEPVEPLFTAKDLDRPPPPRPDARVVSAPLAEQRRVLHEARPRAPEAAVMPRQDAPRFEQRPAAPPVEPLVPPRNLTPPPASPPPPPRPSEPVEPLFTANDLDRPQPPRPEAKPALASLSFSFGGLDQPAASSPPSPPDPRPQSEPEPPLQSPPSPPLHHLRREPEQPAPARTAPDFEPEEAEPPAVELSDEFAADLEASLRESLFGEGTRQDTPAQPVQVAPEPAERAPEPAPPPFFARREAAAPSDYHRDNPFEPSERPHAGSSTAAHEPAFDYHGTEPDYHGTGSDYHGAEPGSYVEPSHPGFESAPAPQSPHGLNLGTDLEQEMASALNEDVYAHGAQRQGAYHDYARNDYAPEGLEQVPHFEQEEKRGGIPVFGIVAGVVIVAIFGGAGAVSYRAIFGETASGPPPVISAGGEPVKVRPENDQAQSDVEDPLVLRGADGDGVENTRIVSRVESLAALPQPNSGETAKIEDRVPQGGDAVTPLEPRVVRPAPIAPDSGVDGPRRVRTLTVRPDGTIEAPPAPEPQVAAQASAAGTLGAADANAGNPGSAPLPGTGGAPSAAQTAAPSTIPLPPPRPGIAVSPVSSAPPPGATARASNPADAPLEVRRVAVERFRTDDNTAAPQGGPVNLVPQTPAGTAPPVSSQQAAAAAPAPVTTQSVASARTAAVAAVQPAAAPQGGYVVQLASRRTQEQALATFSDFQSRFTGQLGNRQPLIQRADLGTRGIFFRVQVGPMAERGEADRLCSDLKSAGLPDCFVQRN